MMILIKGTMIIGCVSMTLTATSLHRTGWLDRVVQYHKNNFYKDFEKVAPIQIHASIIPAPPGYVDSSKWTYDSVVQLLVLIRESKTAYPVRQALRRSLQPSRRFMSAKQSAFHFPSLAKLIPNDIYYDMGSMSSEYEFVKPSGVPDDDAVIVVSNPVEARLPSGRISVKLLREILDTRAVAAKIMPTTVRSTILWIPMNKTTSATASGCESNSTIDVTESGTGGTEATGGEGATTLPSEGTPGEADTTTTAPELPPERK